MEKRTRIRARRVAGHIEIMVLVNHNHPAEAEAPESAAAGAPEPEHYIERMTFELNGKTVAESWLGPGVAENPLIRIGLANARDGDRVAVRWIDNRGGGERVDTVIGYAPLPGGG